MMLRTLSLVCLTAFPAWADAPEVRDAAASETAPNIWRIDVTLAHPDMGWDHFATAWEVLAPDGTSLGLRTLTHPHVDEQPFTRSLSGVTIPTDLSYVMIRARCNLVGWAPALYRLELAR